MSDKTYSEDEHKAILKQVSDLEAKVVELSSAAEASQVDARVTAARAELEEKITDLQSQLDAAVLEAEAAKTEREAIVSWLDAEAQAATEAAALHARKDERVARVKEVASFPDDYLQNNAERFAAMSDEAFQAALEDWKTIAPKAPDSKTKDTGIPAVTAMTASRADGNKSSDVLREVMDFRDAGIDIRTI